MKDAKHMQEAKKTMEAAEEALHFAYCGNEMYIDDYMRIRNKLWEAQNDLRKVLEKC
ncbi:hypothetical protein FP74_gp084 [Bacillus phage CAM003]|uniref:Uncharacterized protein n=1 Tax=Bacillus phage CAM003 TaxID=1486657 RepID=A0A024B046_9CAUD|nr:hypothetical protein FP74_gp084 [Bacillus phage CAM003]AHZ09712.1 hypothetical protein [Bacillus phage CAM003]